MLQFFRCEVLVHVFDEVGVLAHEAGVIPGYVVVDGVGGVVGLEIAIDLEAIAKEDDLDIGAGFFLEHVDGIVHRFVGLTTDVGHANGLARQVLVETKVAGFAHVCDCTCISTSADVRIFHALLHCASVVVTEVNHHFGCIFNGLVQAIFDRNVAEDDALQDRVEEVGEGNPVSEQRWGVEIVGDLSLGNFKAALVQRYVGSGCVFDDQFPNVIAYR